LSQVKVDEMLRLVCDIASKVSTDNDMPKMNDVEKKHVRFPEACIEVRRKEKGEGSTYQVGLYFLSNSFLM